MSSRLPSKRDFRRWGHELDAGVDDGADEGRRWLATPQGRFLRSLAARLLIVSVPLIVRHPFFKTPIGRLVELAGGGPPAAHMIVAPPFLKPRTGRPGERAGGAAILIKLAELLRDWEPTPQMAPMPPMPPMP